MTTAPSPTPASHPKPDTKKIRLARVVARQIETDIMARGWPVGEVLGSEDELQARYGVSRAVFREAVRLVEHKQVGRMRRGPGGGLVVTEPAASTVVDAVTVYLEYAAIGLDELFEARKAIEELAAELAAERMTESGIVFLRERIEREAELGDALDSREHQPLHALIASLTRNPAIELFVEILAGLTPLYSLGPRRELSDSDRRDALHESAIAHSALVEALVAGNAGLARHRMEVHLRATAEWLRRRRESQRLTIDELERGGIADSRKVDTSKLAEVTAGRILGDITECGWPVGEVLGSEGELLQRYDVSRAVFREAVRLLEHHNVVVMRRGPGGGLVVTAPEVSAITDAVSLYLERRGIKPRDLYEARHGLELLSVQLAAENKTDAVAERLRSTLAEEETAPLERIRDVSQNLHIVIAELSGNRAVWLFTLVLVGLTAEHAAGGQPSPRSRERMAEDMHGSHCGIVEAIIDGDAALATHRMQKHLEAIRTWLH